MAISWGLAQKVGPFSAAGFHTLFKLSSPCVKFDYLRGPVYDLSGLRASLVRKGIAFPNLARMRMPQLWALSAP